MPLTLCIQTYRDEFAPAASAARFDASGGTIGRDADNVLVLDDPDKYISRVQASIDCRNGAYYMTDLGRNPSAINGVVLSQGTEARLEHGDLLAIGAYVIAIKLRPEAVLQLASARAPLGLNSSVLPQPPLDKFAQDALAAAAILNLDADQVLQHADPLGVTLFGNAQAATPASAFNTAEHQHIAPETQSFPGGHPDFGAVPMAMTIPEDYDPLADLLPPRSASVVHRLARPQPTVDAAMRAVRMAILDRLNPVAIEEQLAVPSMIDENRIASRKAEMWDRMKLLYEQLSQAADDEFTQLIAAHATAASTSAEQRGTEF